MTVTDAFSVSSFLPDIAKFVINVYVFFIKLVN
jgi:hypothetical protein